MKTLKFFCQILFRYLLGYFSQKDQIVFQKDHLFKGFISSSSLFIGDSAFYNSFLMDILEAKGVNYVIRIKNYQKLVQACIEDCSKKIDLSQCKENPKLSFQGEILYETSQGKKSRVYYELSYDFKGKERVFGVITDLKTETTEEVLNLYRQRGASENFIKELKNGFDAKHLSHQGFM